MSTEYEKKILFWDKLHKLVNKDLPVNVIIKQEKDNRRKEMLNRKRMLENPETSKVYHKIPNLEILKGLNKNYANKINDNYNLDIKNMCVLPLNKESDNINNKIFLRLKNKKFNYWRPNVS